MASNQNRPPRSPTSRKDGDPLDKRRRVGAMKAGNTVRAERRPLTAINKKNDASCAVEGSTEEASVSGSVDFSKQDIESMLNDRLKLKKFDHKGNLELVSDFNSRLKVCIKWFQRRDEIHAEELGRLQHALESSEKRSADLDMELKNKEEHFKNLISDLEETNASLKEHLEKEAAEKLAAMEQYRLEHESRVSADIAQAALLKELEKAQQDIQSVLQRAASSEDMIKRLHEYNSSFQQYNAKLQADLEVSRDTLTRLEKEKSTMVETLSTLRANCDSLKEQLSLSRASQNDAINQKESMANDVKSLRAELQQVREDRDRQLKQVQDISSELHSYKEKTLRSCAELDTLSEKTKVFEETCTSQRAQISLLENQLLDATEKLKMSDLSTTETRMVYEAQQRLVRDLQERLADKERQIMEGELLRKKLHNDILELKGNIRVFCRVRPLLPEDAVTDAAILSYPSTTEALGRGIDVTQNGQTFPFTFDKVFNHDASQEDVFFEISQLVQSSLDGYKVCIFAYGQTGSGKTYTMMGRPENHDQKGLIPRSLEQIFESSKNLLARGWRFKMQASMLEIYNESIRDLLAPVRSNNVDNAAASKQYTIKHDAQGNTHVSDLTVVEVCNVQEISSLLRQAAQSRSVGRTMMNEQSSRSHFVFTLRISGFNEGTEEQVEGVLNLIDLAGSERLSKSGATGDRLKETQAINKSLSSLSDVIFSLAKKEDHVPFRNSKLTYLLQPCLGGNSKTLMFVNISPDSSSVGESLCSLRFAARVNACEIGVARRCA